MLMLLDHVRKRAVESLTTDSDLIFAPPSYGETLPLTIAIVSRVQGNAERLFEPQSLEDWTIRAGIGKPFLAPTSGVFTITFGADTTTALAFDASTATVATALNLLASIISAGGVTVTGIPSYYVVTFTAVGSRAEFTADVTSLAPQPIVKEIGTLVDGGAGTHEIQSIRFLQDAAAIATLDEEPDEPSVTGITTEVVSVGGGGNNAKFRFTFDAPAYDGVWTIVIEGDETTFIAADASADEVLQRLEELTTVGTGNVEVIKEDSENFLIGFKGDKADTDITSAAADGTNLQALPTLGGDLDLNTPALELLFGTSTTLDCFFEIEGTPSGGSPRKLYRQPITLTAPVILPE